MTTHARMPVWALLTVGLVTLLLVGLAHTEAATPQQVTTTGEIAFIHTGPDGPRIQAIQPDGSARRTIWEYPGESGDINDVAWNPDATDLAFTSDIDAVVSPFSADVYAIRPDGSGLRRVTNPPLISDVEAGIADDSLQTGSVQVTLVNNYSAVDPVTFFQLSVRGAASGVTLSGFPTFDNSVEVQIPMVADLPGLQPIVATWASGQCTVGKFLGAPVDVVPGETTEVTVVFDGGGCGAPNNALDVSWQRDGSSIGLLLDSLPVQVSTAVDPFGPWNTSTTWFDSQGSLVREAVWSPADDSIVYEAVGGQNGIFLISQGQTTSQPLLTGGFQGKPAWLPDGSSFLYLENGNIFIYNPQVAQGVQLTQFADGSAQDMSVSPDGNAVAYTFTPNNSTATDIFILDVSDPQDLQISQLTNDGTSRKPDWSRVEPTTPEQTPTPTNTSAPDATATATSDPDATATPTATSDPDATATPTATGEPDATATATPMPQPTTQPVSQQSETVTEANGGGPALDDPVSPVIVDFPPGAVSDDLDVTIFDLDSPTVAPFNYAVLRAFRVEARNAFAELVTEFDQPVVLDIEYDPAVAPFQDFDPASFELLVWDGSTWSPLPEGALERDPENNRIAASVTSFPNPNGGTEYVLAFPTPATNPTATATPDPVVRTEVIYLPSIQR